MKDRDVLPRDLPQLQLEEFDRNLLERAAAFPNAISVALEDRDLRVRISGSDLAANSIQLEYLNSSLKALQEKLMAGMGMSRKYFSGWEHCPSEFDTYRALSIPFLCHFTHVSNLVSIIQNGLVPIKHENSSILTRHTNDQARYDNRLKATSLSVGIPNEKMLSKYRRKNGLWDYVVLALDPTLIWRKTCAFCPHNAADRRVSKTPLESLIGPEALDRMFGEDNWSNRPSDPQAEVLIFGVIEPKWIQGIFTLNDAHQSLISNAMSRPRIFSQVESAFMFSGRASEKPTLGSIVVFQNAVDTVASAIASDNGDRRLLVKCLDSYFHGLVKPSSDPKQGR